MYISFLYINILSNRDYIIKYFLIATTCKNNYTKINKTNLLSKKKHKKVCAKKAQKKRVISITLTTRHTYIIVTRKPTVKPYFL